MRRRALAACLLALLAAGACGGSDTDDAREAAESYVRSVGARDGKATCERMTEDLQRQFVEAVVRANPQFAGGGCAEAMQAHLDAAGADELKAFEQAEIRDLQLDGDSGSFRYDAAPIQVGGKVAKEEGEWKVSCCVPAASGG